MKHIKIADFRIIRKVIKTKVRVIDIPQINCIIFDADGEKVIAKKGERGHLILRCPCDHCGTIGIARGIECRRKLAVYQFLIKMNGRVTDKDIGRELKRKGGIEIVIRPETLEEFKEE